VAQVPECTECGACCFSQLAAYARVTGDDYARLDTHAEQLVWFQGNRAYLRMVDGHCAALELGARAGSYSCSVYQHRPEICRALERGSPECLAEREAKAERPRLLLLTSLT
jgi:uncharacterized protein